MSVMLFSKNGVYQMMADAFEELKGLLQDHTWKDERFYKALRRLYFANVATFLCQYHDDSPLSKDELTTIDPFQGLEGKPDPSRQQLDSLHGFLSAWNSLKYNLVTNDGEKYLAKDSFDFIEQLAQTFSLEVSKRCSSPR